MSHTQQRLAAIRGAVADLAGSDLASSGRVLLDALGYRSPKTLEAPSEPSEFIAAIGLEAAKLDNLQRWRAVHFLFQLTGDELPSLSRGGDPATGNAFQRGAIDSFLFLAIDLDDGVWSRRQLVSIVRELNRAFAMPVIPLFRHGGKATVAVIDRRANRRDASRDVVGGRISLIKDIDTGSPHRAHVEILADLSLPALAARKAPSDFRTLYDLWLDTLSANELNKRFYEELADWFAWASSKQAEVELPRGQGKGEGAKEIALIRLLTRLMFVWFIKEKGLVPDALFDRQALANLLNDAPASNPAGHNYYLAVLQNLFFATLNTEMPDRRWRKDEGRHSKDYLGHHVYRHAAMFAEPDNALEAFASVPFLNGGLFECLDCEVSAEDPRHELAEPERGRMILRIDGFSDQPDKQPRLPNRLFFGGDPAADLTTWFGKRRIGAPGLIDLFERYKFTVEENTPLEEEAALDPELLGKVFENLLASYNEDTRTTARNKSGSFYTPREVVDFMIDEALVAWLLPRMPQELDLKRPRTQELGLDRPGELSMPIADAAPSSSSGPDDEARLRALLNYSSRSHDFSPAQVDALIASIESCKAIDPAVGSGAFPLGLLQKLVHVLDVLDPGGEKWKARNRRYYEDALRKAEDIPAANERATEIEKARAALAEFDAKFDSGHYPDYTRKLFLIDRCLHGVDIQPIAVQIAKLRCFISLAVEQKVDDTGKRPNRGITPLPNLEAKFVAANTLTPLHRRGQAGLVTQDLREKQRDLREANRAFFASANGAAKRAVQKRIKTLREEIAAEVARDHTFADDDARKLASWDPFDPNASAPFFDGEWMFGLSPEDVHFDVVLGNPPYRQIKKNEYSKLDYPFTEGKEKGKQNLYKMFIERAKQLAGVEGQVCLIVQSSLMADASATETRKMLLDHSSLKLVMEFPKKSADATAQVFESVLQGTCIIQFKGSGGTEKLDLSHGNNTKTIFSPVWTVLAAKTIKRLFPHSCIFPLVGPSDLRVMEAIRGQSTLLEALVDVGQSTKGDLNLGTNANMISGDPTGVMLVRGAHVGRYTLKHDGNSWINAKFRPDKRAVNKQKRILVGQNITGTTDPFRLIFCEIAPGQEYLVGDSALKVVPKDDRDADYILACLCSRPLDWYFRRTSTNNHVNVYELLELPIPIANADAKEGISVVVQSILAGAERPSLEALMNAFVYELFFPEDLHARGLHPFAVAREAGLIKLADYQGPALARAADEWSRQLADPAHPLYATLFDLQSIDAVRIIEGRG